MNTWLVIGVSWFVLGLIAYVLILIFFPPTPLFDRKRPESTHGPTVQLLPPFLNSVRRIWLFLMGLLIVPFVAPILLLALVGYRLFKSDNSSS